MPPWNSRCFTADGCSCVNGVVRTSQRSRKRRMTPSSRSSRRCRRRAASRKPWRLSLASKIDYERARVTSLRLLTLQTAQSGTSDCSFPQARASVGYWITPSQRRRGYASEALGILTSWAKQHADLDRLELYVEPWNSGSWRAAELAGYKREGLLRAWERIDRQTVRHVHVRPTDS